MARENSATRIVKSAVVAAGHELGLWSHQFEHRLGRMRADISFSSKAGDPPSVLVEVDHAPDRALWNTNKYLGLPVDRLPAALVSVRFGRATEPWPALSQDPFSSLPGFLVPVHVDAASPDLQNRLCRALQSVLALSPTEPSQLDIPTIEGQYEGLLRIGSGSTLVVSHLKARERQAVRLFRQRRIGREHLAVVIGAQFSLLRRAGDYAGARLARQRLLTHL